MIQEDEKYKALRDQLRALPRVKARPDFEQRLMHRIREAEKLTVNTVHQVKHIPEKKSWFELIFRPAFAPALGLTAVLFIAVIVYFAYFSKINNETDRQSNQFVSSTNQGDLIIYVKKEGSEEDPGSNYPKEYSAVSPEDSRSTEFYSAPHETSTDYLAKPDPVRTVMPEMKPDRVSEEQKIEMQRTVDSDKDKGVDVKSERKLDDGIIMKKESKVESKNGEMKKDSKEPMKKKSDEKKNIYINEDENEINSEGNIDIQQKEENAPVDDLSKRISRATKKDSTKNKSETEADENKETIQQK